MICLEALKSLSAAQTITTLSYSHLFFLSYHKGHNWTREKGTFTLPFRWFKYHQKQHSDYKYNMFGNNCFSIFEKNRNFIHIREMKKTFFLCCEQNVAVRHWEVSVEHRALCSLFRFHQKPGSRSRSALAGFLNERVTSCKPTSKVRKILSHFSCSCPIFKTLLSFSHQVVKMC